MENQNILQVKFKRSPVRISSYKKDKSPFLSSIPSNIYNEIYVDNPNVYQNYFP